MSKFNIWMANVDSELYYANGTSIEDYPEYDFDEAYMSCKTEEEVAEELTKN